MAAEVARRGATGQLPERAGTDPYGPVDDGVQLRAALDRLPRRMRRAGAAGGLAEPVSYEVVVVTAG